MKTAQKNTMKHQLEDFNHRRAARGMMPVTGKELRESVHPYTPIRTRKVLKA